MPEQEQVKIGVNGLTVVMNKAYLTNIFEMAEVEPTDENIKRLIENQLDSEFGIKEGIKEVVYEVVKDSIYKEFIKTT